MAGALNWFEIPVTDIERATKFYETILGKKFVPMEATAGYPMSMFPDETNSGCLIQGEGYEPSTTGVLVYLNCNPDLHPILSRVPEAGGAIETPKTNIGDNGFMAFITDTEGNRIGLHSNE